MMDLDTLMEIAWMGFCVGSWFTIVMLITLIFLRAIGGEL